MLLSDFGQQQLYFKIGKGKDYSIPPPNAR